MDLSGLHALWVVAEKRSFTAAAAALQVTPSAVSQTIRALEERVGVRLLQRTTRSVGLTEAGQRFVQHLRPALEQVQTAFDSVAELRDGPAGTLRLNVPRAAYNQVLEPILSAFLVAHPHVNVEVILEDTFANIIETGCDAGIRIGEMLDSEMVALRLGDDDTSAIVGSPAYFAAHGKPKHPRDLQHHSCINFRRMLRNELYRWEFSEHGKDFEIAVQGRLTFNDGEAMIRAAIAGLGLVSILESSVREHLKAGRLVRVLEPYCPPFPGFFLYYPSRRQVAPKLQALIDFLKKKRRPRAR